jgi:hypothetical protein
MSALWANRAFEKLRSAGRKQQAENIASQYRIITPYSAAAVLERDSDYQSWGLKTGDYVDGPQTGASASFLIGATNGTAVAGATGGGASMLQGATNGMIGPQGVDRTYIQGVNTAGTVRVNNLANLEAVCYILALVSSFGVIVLSLVAFGFALVPSFVPGLARKGRRLFAIAITTLLLGTCASTLIQVLIPCMRYANFLN